MVVVLKVIEVKRAYLAFVVQKEAKEIQVFYSYFTRCTEKRTNAVKIQVSRTAFHHCLREVALNFS